MRNHRGEKPVSLTLWQMLLEVLHTVLCFIAYDKSHKFMNSSILQNTLGNTLIGYCANCAVDLTTSSTTGLTPLGTREANLCSV